MKYLALYGLKFPIFRPDCPIESLHVTKAVHSFIRRVELGLWDGGFALITGDPGTGKSIVLRLLAEHLHKQPEIVVGTLEHPQSRTGDFYRELGDLFGVTLSSHNRWGGFKALRARWSDHIAQTRVRPVLIIDEAQEMPTAVLNEIRILASKDFDSRQLLCVIFAGDARLSERFRTAELLPLGSRIRRRLQMEYAQRDELLACLDHQLTAAGNPSLMTDELKAALADHAAGNFRVLMHLAEELLTVAADRDLTRLDEKLYFEVFGQVHKAKSGGRKK